MTQSLKSNERYEDNTFEDVKLVDQIIESSIFTDCVFSRCHFPERTFSGCRFVNVTFHQCDLSLLHIPGSTFSGCEVTGTKCTGIDWTAGDWEAPVLRNPLAFIRSDLSHSTFLGLPLKGIRVEDCVVHDVDFREANLSRAVFHDSDLAESLFGRTDLSEADFSSAKNYQIDPLENTISGAIFSLPDALALLYALDIKIEE